MDEAVVMEFGQRMAALLNECPEDVGFGLLVRFLVQAAEQMTEDQEGAMELIFQSVKADFDAAPLPT